MACYLQYKILKFRLRVQPAQIKGMEDEVTVDKKVQIPYGQSAIEFTLPESNLVGVFSPKKIPGVADLAKEIDRALRHPIG